MCGLHGWISIVSASAYIFEIYTHRFHFGARLFLAKIKSHRHTRNEKFHTSGKRIYIAGLNLVICFRAENDQTNEQIFAHMLNKFRMIFLLSHNLFIFIQCYGRKIAIPHHSWSQFKMYRWFFFEKQKFLECEQNIFNTVHHTTPCLRNLLIFFFKFHLYANLRMKLHAYRSSFIILKW